MSDRTGDIGAGHAALIALVVGAILFLANLSERNLFGTDEPKYAEVAREMLRDGHWIVPHWEGQVYSEKPPVFFWSVAICSLPFGRVTEISSRLPSAFSALLVMLGCIELGRVLFGSRRAGLHAALAFAVMGGVGNYARQCKLDMPLAATVVWGFCGLWAEPPGKWGRARALGYVAMGLGNLIKGPVAMLPMAVVAIADLLERRRPLAGRGLLPGLGIMLAIAAAWLYPAYLVGGEEYIQRILFRQTVQRYVNPWMHVEGPWYYLRKLPGMMAPWTLLLPFVAIRAWRSPPGTWRSGYARSLLWLGLIFLFFEVSPGKRQNYLLVLLPAAALASGGWLEELWRRNGTPASRRVLDGAWRLFLGALAAAALGLAALMAFAVYAPAIDGQALQDLREFLRPSPLFPLAPVFGGLLFLGTVAAGVSEFHGAREASIRTAFGSMVFAGFLVHAVYSPPYKNQESDRAACEAVNARLAPGVRWGVYNAYTSSFVFYGETFPLWFTQPKPVAGKGPDPEREAAARTERQRLTDFLRAPSRILLLAPRPDAEALESANEPGLYRLGVFPFEDGRKIVLLSNRPDF